MFYPKKNWGIDRFAKIHISTTLLYEYKHVEEHKAAEEKNSHTKEDEDGVGSWVEIL